MIFAWKCGTKRAQPFVDKTKQIYSRDHIRDQRFIFVLFDFASAFKQQQMLRDNCFLMVKKFRGDKRKMFVCVVKNLDELGRKFKDCH
jgi:hypothetical protein